MDTGELLEAARSHHAVELVYRGRDGDAARIVHPHAVYRTASRKLCLDAVQVGGETRSGGLPGWRLFELMRVADIRVLDATFDVDPEYDPTSPKYRHGLLASA
jgi:predicted DNA-binding transcriptional regulator YafY